MSAPTTEPGVTWASGDEHSTPKLEAVTTDRGIGSGAGKRHAGEGHLAHLAKRLLIVALVGGLDQAPTFVHAVNRALDGRVAHRADTVRESVVQRLEFCRGLGAWREPGGGRRLGETPPSGGRGRRSRRP